MNPFVGKANRSLVQRALLTLCLLCLAVPTASQGAPGANLVRNPGLEAPVAQGMPAGWEPLIIGANPTFAVDVNERHEGQQSVRVTATEVTRSYLRSEAIEVAPGEQLTAGAWVKTRGVPVDQGTVIAIAEFDNGQGAVLDLSKVGVADLAPAATGWQHISGTVTVPALATTLRLRLGLSYSSGTCWWDDVTVHAAQDIVARVELPAGRLSPASGMLPVTVLNRATRREPLSLTLTLAGVATETPLILTGAAVQRVDVPLKIVARGKATLQVTLGEAGAGAPLFQTQRDVTIPPPLTVGPLLPTHWVSEDGVPRLEAEADLEVSPEECRGAVLHANLLDTAGAVRATWSSDRQQPAPDGYTRFSMRIPGLPQGAYRLITEFRPAQGAPIRAEQLWAVIPRRLAEVKLNANGYLEQNGKAIFPLGIFNGGARLKEAAVAGFTVEHAYNAVRVEPGQRPDDQRAKGFLDAAEAAGMKALFLLPNPVAIAGDWDAFRHRIRLFRNHPGLLAWDEEEGIARGDMKPETLAQIRAVLREEDSHHPLMVGDSRDVITRVTDRSNFFPLADMDLGMWWWYPLPLRPAAGNALQGEEKTASLTLDPPSFLAQRNTDKPLWVGVQSYKKPQPWARYPNATEYRAQAYIALIHGAKGLMWYGGSVQGGLFLAPQEAHWDDLRALASELNGLSEVFMAPALSTPKFAPANAPISVALKQAPDRLVLLAANRGPDTVDITFQLTQVSPNSTTVPLTVLSEKRTVAVTGNQLRDQFLPYAVHVYQFPARPARAER